MSTTERVQHTPGPWTLTRGDTWPWNYQVSTESGRHVVAFDPYTYGSADKAQADVDARPENAEGHANARLIAAAPERLAALHRIAALLTAALDDCGHENECEVDEAGDGCTCVVNRRVWEPLRKAEREARKATEG